jgi:hypothetical protein
MKTPPRYLTRACWCEFLHSLRGRQFNTSHCMAEHPCKSIVLCRVFRNVFHLKPCRKGNNASERNLKRWNCFEWPGLSISKEDGPEDGSGIALPIPCANRLSLLPRKKVKNWAHESHSGENLPKKKKKKKVCALSSAKSCRDSRFFKFFKLQERGKKGGKERYIYNLKKLTSVKNTFSNSLLRVRDI